MNSYTPDKWVVVKIPQENGDLLYKVFGCWFGGYTQGNSWKLNSGIKKVSQDPDTKCWIFEGHSGSSYHCHPALYGTHSYGASVLQNFIEQSRAKNRVIEILPETTPWESLL